LAILFRPFDCPAPKDFKVMWLSNILTLTLLDEDYFRNVSVVHTEFDIHIFITITGSVPLRLHY